MLFLGDSFIRYCFVSRNARKSVQNVVHLFRGCVQACTVYVYVYVYVLIHGENT